MDKDLNSVGKDSSENILIVFLKYPKAGEVKRRLAADIGKKEAASLYKEFTEFILGEVKSDCYRIIIFYTPQSREKEVRSWLGDGFEYCPQQGSDLGERMQAAFKLVFDKGAKRAVIIGTDNPLVDRNILSEAFGKLRQNQAVIGPCLDGGYYLLGLSSYSNEIFKDIAWGTDEVFEKTIGKLKQAGFKYEVLKKEFDIDNLEDIKLLEKELKENKTSMPGGLRELLAKHIANIG